MRYFPLIAAAAATLALVAQGGPAPARQQPEYMVKARYLLALSDYVTWPGHAEGTPHDRPLVLGILGSSPLEQQLNNIYRATPVKGRQIILHTFRSQRDYEPCDILFVCESEGGHLQELLKLLKGKPVLTMADSANFARRGVMINLYVDQDRVRFEINLAAVRASGLEVGSRVLKLAILVE